MKYVHSSNVLHRDLKPCNILVNGNCDLQICDFGCARVLNENNIDEVDFTSEYVTTRWYRAPEVLLSSSQYGKEIDMWSLGCIFAELILRQPIFQGKSTLNQLSVINEIIGSPTDNDLLYIDNDNARKFMNSLQKFPSVNWKKLLNGASTLEIDLIMKMLKWNPKNRITANEAVNHPFFIQIHDHLDERIAYPMENFDFERKNISFRKMRKYIWNEIQQLHGEPMIKHRKSKSELSQNSSS